VADVLDFTGNGTGDQTAIETQASKGTIRTRALDAASALKKRTFNNSLRYGSYLVDEEQLDVIATSLSVKGKHIGGPCLPVCTHDDVVEPPEPVGHYRGASGSMTYQLSIDAT